MLGVVEKDAKTAVGELLNGIVAFYDENPNTGLNLIKFVIYESGEVMNQLQNRLQIEG